MPTDPCPTDRMLDAFRRGDLPDAEAGRVSRHLDQCPACEARANPPDTEADPVVAALHATTINPTARLAAVEQAPDAPPESVGGYQVIGELGRGGMGVVYKARQVGLNRVVAVKMIVAGRYAGAEEQVRFRIEGEVLARLRHPNIVQVYETGRHDGRPFLVLEWVEGGNLEGRLAGGPLAPATAAGLIEPVARAVHYAHLNGVVHRDLKPANILLAADGTPKVTDFGLAKPAGDADAGLTMTGAVMGTPAYMAPEQARGDGKQVGPPADVHALGAILFALLTGRPPFQAGDPSAVMYQVITHPAPPASRFRRGLPRDLVTICGRCMEKEPGKRYASAEHLADDLRRFREGRPILARPTPAWERAWLAARRRPLPAALFAAVCLSLAAGVGAAGWQWREAVAARGAAVAEARVAGRRAARLSVEKGLALCETWEVSHGLLWLVRGLDEAERAGDPDLARAARANVAAWAGRVPRPVGRPPARAPSPFGRLAGPGAAVVFTPDGRHVVGVGWDYCLDLWRVADGAQLNPARQLVNPFGLFAGSLGARAAAVRPGPAPAGGATLALAQADGYATIWAVAPGRVPECRQKFRHPQASVWDVAFSPDGAYLLTGCDDGRGRVWHADTGRLVAELDHSGGGPGTAGRGGVYAVAFPAAGLAVTGSRGGGTCLWRLADVPAAAGPPVRMRSGDGTAYLLSRHMTQVFALAAHAGDGRTRILTGGEGAAEVWELADPGRAARAGPPPGPWAPQVRYVGALPGHANRLGVAAFSPDGRTGLTADHDGYVRLWDADTLQPLGEPVRHAARVTGAGFSPDGHRFVLAGADDRVAVRDVPTPGRVGPAPDAGAPVLDAWPHPPDGTVRAVTLDAVREWTAAGDARPVWAREGADRAYAVQCAAVAPDGGAVFLGAIGAREHRVWGPARFGPRGAKFPTDFRVAAAAFSPDGAGLVTLHWGDEAAPTARRWDVSGAAPRPVPGWAGPPLHRPGCAAFSPDGRLLLIGCRDAAVLLDAATGRAVGGPLAATAAVTAVAFRADGTAAVGGQDGTIRLWDPVRRAAVGPAVQAGGGITSLAFGGDGGLLLSGSNDGTARFWDTATGLPLGPPLRHRRAVHRVRFAPDGRTALTAGADGLVLRWRCPTRRPRSRPTTWPPRSGTSPAWTSGRTACPAGRPTTRVGRDRPRGSRSPARPRGPGTPPVPSAGIRSQESGRGAAPGHRSP